MRFKLYKTYVEELCQINAFHFTPGVFPRVEVFNAFAWGLVEELQELKFAKTLEDVKKEAGDVLAYSTLLLLSVAGKEDVAEIFSLWDSTSKFDSLAYFSNLKRINREGAEFNWTQVLKAWQEVVNFCWDVHRITEEEIALTNIAKLKDRITRGVMLKGSGDSR